MSIASRWKEKPALSVAHQAERALLGVLILSPKLALFAGELRPTDFYSPFHAAAFEEIIKLGKHTDEVTLYHALRHRRPPIEGWASFVGDLLEANCCVEEEMVESYAAIVREASTERKRASWRK